MSYSTIQSRLPSNVSGRFYVTDQCLDCELCHDTAPTVFKRLDSEGIAFVFKQPESDEELHLAFEALLSCPCDAIHADGDALNYCPGYIAAMKPKSCSHCDQPKGEAP